MDDFLDEPTFNAVFGQRLQEWREGRKITRPSLAYSLGITKDQLKRYETRSPSGFPLYLLPQLIRISGQPYTFWLAEPLTPGKRAPLAIVRSR